MKRSKGIETKEQEQGNDRYHDNQARILKMDK